MLRAVLFDLDDTLLDFAPAQARTAYREGAQRTYEYLKGRGLPVPSFQKFYSTHCAAGWRNKWMARLTGREQSVRHVFRKLCMDLRLQRDEVSLARLGWLWYEPLARSATVAADVIPTLTALHEAGIALGVVCNTPLQGEVIDQHLKLEGVYEFFPVRVYSSDVGHRKPDRRIFEVALVEMKLNAGEAMYVGDVVKTDIIGARRAGMLAVQRVRRSDRRGHRAADFCVHDISELLKLEPIRTVIDERAALSKMSRPSPVSVRRPVA